jgi:mannose-1-phosphate guanylyltransferase
MADLGAVDVVVLAGGLGSRIRHVLGDTPKVLADINGRPFLAHLLDRLATAGAGRVVLALGHLADRVQTFLATCPTPLPAVVAIEPEPLGTAGALRFVFPTLRTDPVLVLNGDTWLDADFGAFLAEHRRSGAPVSMLVIKVNDVARYGRVELDDQGCVARFVEKDPDFSGPGLINGGACLFSAGALSALAADRGQSLERDFLASLPPGSIHAHLSDAGFIDIGTPETLAMAAAMLPRTANPS